jgi:ABC-type transport system involved in multi-copper enzyme maturation permease subunit
MWPRTLLVAAHEWRRNVRRVRGRIGLAGTLLWLGVPAVIAAFQVPLVPSAMELQQKARSLVDLYDIDVARAMTACPNAFVLLALTTMFFIPVLTLALGFDVIAEDISKRGDRLPLLRTSRSSILLGKSLGLWAVCLTFMLAAYAPACAAVLVRGGSGSTVHVLLWGVGLYLAAGLVSAVYVAIWSSVGAVVGSPKSALLAGLAVVVVLGAAHLVLRRVAPGLAALLPGGLDGLWLSGHAAAMGTALVATAAWCAMALATGALTFARRDL